MAVAVATCWIEITDWVGRMGAAVMVSPDRTCSGIGVRADLSGNAAGGNAVAVAGCVTMTIPLSHPSVTFGTWTLVGIGSEIVLVVWAGGNAVFVGVNETAVAVGDITAVDVPG